MRLIGRIFLWVFAFIGMMVTLAVSAAIVAAIYFPDIAETPPDRIVLRLDLNQGISDERPDSAFWQTIYEGPNVTLHGVVAALDSAAKDDRVVGLAAQLGSAPMNIAVAQELRQAVERFRASGKFALAFSAGFGGPGDGTPEYYLASAFDDVWLQPSGSVGITGISLEMPFAKEAFDKYGVQAEFEQRHEYKTAAEVFTRKMISLPARQSLERVLNSWMRQILGDVGTARKLTTPAPPVADGPSALLAGEALDSGLIDQIGYWDEFEGEIRKRANGAQSMDALAYGAIVATQGEPAATAALIYGTGPIQPGQDEEGPFGVRGFSGAQTVAAINAAIKDDGIKAIILRINSPGGSYVASDSVHRAVLQAQAKGKVVVATMGEYGASGGYFAAMAADRIVAQPGTLTGSIGVFGGKFALGELWRKLGVNWSSITSGGNAGMWSSVQPFSPAAAARHSAMLDEIYRDFTGKLAVNRNLEPDRVNAVARAGSGPERTRWKLAWWMPWAD